MTEDRRHPHRPFDPEAIQGYLRGRKVDSVHLFPSGKSNSNYKLTVDGEICVLRLYPGNTAARERKVMQFVEELVPVPQHIDSGEDWALFSFVEGEHLADHPEATRAAAQMATRIWEVKFAESGWINSKGNVVPFDFGGEEDFGTAMLRDDDVNKWLGPQAVQALARIFQIEAERPEDSQSGGCLVHGDFNPSNVLVRGQEVVAVLDWEFSHSGGPFMDISNLVRHTPKGYHQHVRDGVESSGMELPDDWLQRCLFAHVGSYLEFLTTQRSDDFKQQCTNKIHQFIEKYREDT